MSTPLLCVTVTASSLDELRARRDQASAVADLVELRLDGVRDPDVAGALAGRTVPVIVTCRARREGGSFGGSEEERVSMLGRAAGLGAEYVDVEWDTRLDESLRARHGRGVVLSRHDFTGVPRDLHDRYRAMRATGAEVVKLAVTAHSLSDNLPLLTLGRETGEDARTALVAMGAAGLPSRILAAHFHSCWSYAGDGVAPGQIPPCRLLGEFRFRAVTAATRVYGVVGRPIEHSVSPAIHNAAFAETPADAIYVPLAATSADDFWEFAIAVGLAGASVTAPFKMDLLARVREVGDEARRAGAVNTLKAMPGGWHGDNTDAAGFLRPLDDRGVALRGVRATVVGTGGAARSVVVALGRRGASVTVHGRDRARAERVAELAHEAKPAVGPPRRGDWDLLVNATPVGTWPSVGETPVDASALAGGGIVYDLVYNPERTRLLREAEASGCRCIGGREMLVAQAAAQFEWWMATPAPRETMRAAAARRISEMAGAE